ncbi:MAG: YggT family protein, partial [Gammaproteobacteria bacterium]|nr:YggT family protein [Gammaproteobacteria bacterium]
MRALISLLDLLFYVYTIILLLRLLLQKLGANYFNPIVQFLVKVTEPIIRPLRSILPGFRGYDLGAII